MQQCSEEKAACVQHPQRTTAAGVVTCAAGSRSTVSLLPGDQLTCWQSLKPQIYHGLHQAVSSSHKDCGDLSGGPAQECGCAGLQLQGVPESATAWRGWQGFHLHEV